MYNTGIVMNIPGSIPPRTGVLKYPFRVVYTTAHYEYYYTRDSYTAVSNAAIGPRAEPWPYS